MPGNLPNSPAPPASSSSDSGTGFIYDTEMFVSMYIFSYIREIEIELYGRSWKDDKDMSHPQ
jgi:hypothetical protein